EDGIRGGHVTGVQTCALPISSTPFFATTRSGSRDPCRGKSRPFLVPCLTPGQGHAGRGPGGRERMKAMVWRRLDEPGMEIAHVRSEERRVGKEGGCRGGAGR